MPPRGGSSESKAGLVISLILFILLSLVLGGTTYSGYKAAHDQEAKAKEAEKKRGDWEAAADWELYVNLMDRAFMGQPLNDEKALETTKGLRAKFKDKGGPAQARFKEQNAALLAELEKKYGWNEAEMKPNTSYEKALAKTNDDLKKLTATLNDAKKDLDARTAEVQALKRDKKAMEEDFDKRLKDLEAKMDKQLKDTYLARINQLVADYDKLSKEKAKEKSDFDEALAKKEKEMEKLKKDLRDLGHKLARLESEVEKKEKESPVALGQPKGKIFRMDATGEMPYIDLGSADNLKTQVTFSVHGVGTDGKPLRDWKAKLEVIRIVGDHLSQARITEWRDRQGDPVLPGDLLFSLGWSPHLKQHVVVVGEIDLNGDGRDDLPEFLRTLERQNVVVDGYLDMKTLQLKGQISRQTDLLILGIGPELKGVVKDDTKTARKTEIIKAMTALQDEASRFGVKIVKLKDFLDQTGYRLPRPASSDRANFDALRRPPTGRQ